jgi:hypothetical protein
MKKVNPVEKIAEEYMKYRWFYTSSGKLVYGGKNAIQNEEIISYLIETGKDFIVMHTKNPGSPFSVINSASASEKDLEEVAIFTACFSRAWKDKEKKVVVDVFRTGQIFKDKKMKTGTFGVRGEIKKKVVEMKLYFAIQKGVLRAVPQKKTNSVVIVPGSIDKNKIAEIISVKENFSLDELIQAIPTGGSDFLKKRASK